MSLVVLLYVVILMIIDCNRPYRTVIIIFIKSMHQSWVIMVEFLITMTILLEIAIRLTAEGDNYFKNKWNLVDIGAFTLILILITIFYVLK